MEGKICPKCGASCTGSPSLEMRIQTILDRITDVALKLEEMVEDLFELEQRVFSLELTAKNKEKK